MRENKQKTIATLVLLALLLATSAALLLVSSVRAAGQSGADSTAGQGLGPGAKPMVIVPNLDKDVRVNSGWKLFLVGTNTYDNLPDKFDLHYAVKDVQSLKRQFMNLGVPEENITLLTSDQRGKGSSRKKNILASFDTFVKGLGRNDSAFVYLSGHGFRFNNDERAYYAPQDVELDDIRDSGVLIDSMLEQLKKSSAKFKWMTVDACRSDPEDNSKALGGVTSEFIVNPSNLPDAFVFMQGCANGQISLESPALEQGLLTYSLLEALQCDDNPAVRGNDGELVFNDLITYVQKRTNELAHMASADPTKPFEQVPHITCAQLPSFTLLTNLRRGGITENLRQLIEAEEMDFNNYLDHDDFTRAQDSLETLADYYPGGVDSQQYKTLADKLEEAKRKKLERDAVAQKKKEADDCYIDAQDALKAKEYASAKTYIDEALVLYQAQEYKDFRAGALTRAVKAAVNQAIIDGEAQKAKSLNMLLAELDANAAKENESKIKTLKNQGTSVANHIVVEGPADDRQIPPEHIQPGWKIFLVGMNTDKIHYSINDVELIKLSFIRLGVPKKNITIITSESRDFSNSIKENIETAFKRYVDSLEKGDKAFVYLTGYRFFQRREKRAYDIPPNADLTSNSSLIETSVSLDAMIDMLLKSKASLKWLSTDVSRVDGEGKVNVSDHAVTKDIYVSADFMIKFDDLPYNFIYMQACEKGSYAIEAPEIQNSLMAYALLEALQINDNLADKDKKGELTLIDILKYVQNRTDELAHMCRDGDNRPCTQRPVITCNGIENITMLTNLRHGGLTKEWRRQVESAEKKFNSFLEANDFEHAKESLEILASYYPNGTEAEEYQNFKMRLAEAEGEVSEKDEGSLDTSQEHAPGELLELKIGEVNINFCWAPAGTFMMGSPETEEGHWFELFGQKFSFEQQHQVKLTRGFWIAETETTQELWNEVMDDNPSFLYGPSQLPVENVSWDNCQEFIDKLNSSFMNKLPSGYKFALPTEAQWEYACRAGTTTPFSFGSTLNGDNANCNGNNPYGTNEKGTYKAVSMPVKSYAPNAWGLYDMHGNVWEWCADWYDKEYYAISSAGQDPSGPTSGTNRVLRGGAWAFPAIQCRSAYRDSSLPDKCHNNVGFRLVLTQ